MEHEMVHIERLARVFRADNNNMDEPMNDEHDGASFAGSADELKLHPSSGSMVTTDDEGVVETLL